MKLRAPAYPLITVDPFFSIWSMCDKLNDDNTKHWTGSDNRLEGNVIVDGKKYCFMGKPECKDYINQTDVDFDALSTVYSFANDKIKLTATFTTPLLLDNLSLASRPVSYLKVNAENIDGKEHEIRIEVTLNDEICQNKKFDFNTEAEIKPLSNCVFAKVGSSYQGKMLRFSGDNRRIEWGYACLACDDKNAKAEIVTYKNQYSTKANDLRITADNGSLFIFAYDDVKCIEYFGEHLTSVWNKDGKTIEKAVEEAVEDYTDLKKKCDNFSSELRSEAIEAGGEKYYEILALAYRQSINAHKICVDKEDNILFISKECFSNGCAATVDVTYPSIPLYLLYNPELVKGMLRPVFRYAESEEWHYKFAPHDVGQYPKLNGQVYSEGTGEKNQMPVEECGNMLVATAAICLVEKSPEFANKYIDTLRVWCNFLIDNGMDPNNQLCTDDFAGHLAHNCNLSIKAIMGIASFALICKMNGDDIEYNNLMNKAKDMGKEWVEKSKNDDNSFRLAFDRENTFSMKYNAVWDKLFKTNIFPKDIFDKENKVHIEKHTNKYGLPLDNRESYTKSDWLVWTATLSNEKSDFVKMTDKLWDAYNESESRVPMTDWYWTNDAKMRGFQNRSVQGGLFIKLLEKINF